MELTRWWNGLGQEIQLAIFDVLIAFAGLLAGVIAGSILVRLLTRSGIDRYLHTPWMHADTADRTAIDGRKLAPITRLMGWLMRLTVWAGAASIIASNHHAQGAVATIPAGIGVAWRIGLVVFLAVLASGWLAHTAYALFQSPWLKRELNALFENAGTKEGSFSESAARFVCIVIYAAFLLLVPVAAASLFNFGALSALAGPAWELCVRLLCIPVAFAVGYLGIALVRSQGKQQAKQGIDRSNAEYYIGVGITVGTTLLSLGILLGVTSGGGVIVLVVFLALAAFVLWPIRRHFHDIWAGLLLRLQGVEMVIHSGRAMEVKKVGILITHLQTEGEELVRKNSDVLRAALDAAKPAVREGESELPSDRNPMQEV